MENPWKGIRLSDYENHMKLDSVRQLQSLNQTMKSQLEDFDVHTAVILGIAGGNGVEHIDIRKYSSVCGVDVNESYLQAVSDRYGSLNGILTCLNLDITRDADQLPKAELVIADLLIEYVGYSAFSRAIKTMDPRYVSCVIQINEAEKQWVSDSPYIHCFDGLDSIHCQMDRDELTRTMKTEGYRLIGTVSDELPNGKSLVRLDYQKSESF